MSGVVEALTQFFEYRMNGVYTAMPCRILRVMENQKAMYVDVQPLTKMVYMDGVEEDRPPILGVPLITLCSSTSMIYIPPVVGDSVLCVFTMRGLDTFKLANDISPVAPDDYRWMDVRDAIAIPGLFPMSQHPNNTVDAGSSLTIIHNIGTAQECKVEMKEDGEVSVVSPLKVSITSPDVEIEADVNITGTTTITGATTIVGTTLINGKNFDLHAHSGVTSGGSSTGPVV